MGDTTELLRAASSVLLVDWPSRDVPDSLVRAGLAVTVKGGPGPEDYTADELVDDEVVSRHVGRAPDFVDVVYSHRPLAELPGIVAMATELGATTVWWQSGLSAPDVKDVRGCWVAEEQSRGARALAEAAGLAYVDHVYIGDAAREAGGAQ